MGENMNYPDNPIDFIKQYSFSDKQRVYTNGSELISVFRVGQMIEHYMSDLTPQQIKDMQFCLREKSRECGELRREIQELKNKKNDGWIPVEERLPENGTDVLVVLKPTYESDYIEYSIARYLRFENDEAHWCDNHYGYLEWEKYSDGHGGSSWYRVVAWQKLDSYHPERSDNHDRE